MKTNWFDSEIGSGLSELMGQSMRSLASLRTGRDEFRNDH